MEAEHTVSMYFVRYFDPIRKKRFRTGWRMTEEDAAKHFSGQEYEILRQTREDRVIGGGAFRNTLGHLQVGWSPDRYKPK